jgi:hypothetical protein
VRRHHAALAGHASHQALEHRPESVPHVRSAAAPIAFEQALRSLEDFLVYDGRVLAVVGLVLVSDLAEVDAVGEQLEQAVLVERPLPSSMSPSKRFSAGRSMLPPVNPPSSYLSGKQTQPSLFWLAMKASPASRWASRLLNSCSSPSSVLLRV